MMDVGLKAWAELVQRIYPELPILRDRSLWLAGQFDRPSVFIETDLVSDKAHTPRADRIIEDVGLVFHYDIDRSVVEEDGEPIPLDLSPFFLYLRQRRFCVVSKRFGIMMVIEAPRTRPQNDRMEVTFRYSFLTHVPKLMIRDDGRQIQKINDFFIEPS
ncbi:hypothetical protein NSQ90_16040 [Paenibacillus sp. FSL H7-0737]|uniref:hypothetical protein n=1 Tax=Paenibacillus sp. FSL H7-0737 TaxID=1536775 RepID=UPI0004F6DA5A|nr:hypothetical protein [Paenibacillus sp. FSL H7-0737]AIQ24260.1 hypothetical protein H70737_16180 [Paenibacillus sp. FSL H7-0737]